MAKFVKRFAAVILCLLTVCSVVWSCFTVTAASDVLFSDTFSATDLSGWTAKDVGKVADGTYTVTGTGMNTVAGQKTAAGLGVVANVSVARTNDAAGERYNNGTASLVFHVSENQKAYYEYGLGIGKSGQGYLIAYLVKADGTTSIIKKQAKNINGVVGGAIRENTVYELKVLVVEDKIQFVINNQIFAETTDQLKSGGVGVAAWQATANVADFSLQKLGEKTVESIQVLNAPQKVAIGAKMGFKVQVNYRGIYGSEVLEEDAQGLTMSGYPEKEGQATLTVSFGGKSDSFTTRFEGKALPQEIFHSNGFTDATQWTCNKDANLPAFAFRVQGGKLELPYPKLNGYNGGLKTSAVANIDSALLKGVTNFCIEAEGAIITENQTAIKERVSAMDVYIGGVYNVRVELSGDVRLNKDTTTLAMGKASGIELGKKITFKIDVYENIWGIDINGERVISYKYAGEAVTPKVAVQAANCGVAVYSCSLTETPEQSIWAAKSVALVDADGNPVSKFSSRGLDVNALFLKCTFKNGYSRVLPVTEDMIHGYNASEVKPQKLTLSYGNYKTTFTYERHNYIFRDSFDTKYKSGWTFTHPEYARWFVKDGKMVVDYYNIEATSSLATLANYESIKVTDAAVGMDVRFTGGNLKGTIYAGVQFRKNNGNMYEYSIGYRSASNSFTIDLYRYNGNAPTLLATYPQAAILEVLGRESLSMDEQFNLRAEAMGKEIYLFVNGKMLGAFIDSSKDAVLTEGYCTIKTVDASALIDNYYIQEMEKRYPVDVQIVGTEDNTLSLYHGFEIDPSKYQLQVTFSDGSRVTVPARGNFFSQLKGFAVGDNTVTLTYGDYSRKITIKSVERPEYVAAFVEKVNKVDPAKLSAAEQATVKALKDEFSTLSPIEVEQLDQNVYKKYCDLIVAMDRIITPSIADKELLYYNDFHTEFDTDAWDFEFENVKTGTWDVRNGYAINEQNVYNVSGNGWAVLKNLYGEINMVEVDMAMVYPSVYTAIAWNLTDDGTYYHCRITNKLSDEYGKTAYTLQLYRCDGGTHKNLAQTYAAVHEVAVVEGSFNTFRIVQNDGLITVFVDEQEVFSYNDTSADASYEGTVAFKSSENDSMYDNLRVYGTVKEKPADKPKQITPTVYEDDFEDETVGKSPSHWQEEYITAESRHVDNWKVYNKGGSKVYGTNGGNTTYSWLHAFECDPTISAKLMYTGSGKVGILTRGYQPVGYTAIGYDTATKKWFVAAAECDKQDGVQTVYAEEATPLSAGEMHDVEVTLAGSVLKVSVDGAVVLTCEDLITYSFGKMGVFAQSAAMYIDQFKATSPNGSNFDDGVLQFNITNSGGAEIKNMGNGVMLAAGKGYISYDHGYTWKSLAESSSGINPLNTTRSGYTSYLGYGKGEWIYVDDNDFGVYRSTDDMRTWNKISTIIPKEELYDDYGNFIALIHVSSLTEVTLKDGTKRTFLPVAFRRYTATTSMGHYTRIFYSDDHGKTWKESENDSRDVWLGYSDGAYSTTAEGKVIICADGAVRYYQTRNGHGTTCYLESDDGGVTWNEFGLIPYMQSTLGSFGIGEDPENPGTYYMAWQNTWPLGLGSIYPRVRISLARTTDGKNWEYLTDIERTSVYSNDFHEQVRQFLDPDVEVTEDYVYVLHGRSTIGIKNSSHNDQVFRYTRFEKDQLKARAWDDATIWDTNRPDHIEIGTMPQTKFGYADLFNTTGGTVKEINLNGTVNENSMRKYTIIQQPNMYKLGKQTVEMYSNTLHKLSYEIEVVPNYDLIWTIKGKGTIDPDPDGMLRMMEGAEQTFTLKPAKGYKVGSVTINGNKVKVRKNTFTIQDVQENQEITVVFAKLTILDYLIWIILGSIVVAGAAVGVIFLIKKKKPKAEGGEVEDISSNSTPPAGEN